MEEGKLPLEIAQEPVEEAHLSQGDAVLRSPVMAPVKNRNRITFAEDTQATENGSQASTASTYKDILSQPAPGLSHRQRLLWLQKRRTPGLWVQCDDCDRWRFLPDVLDSHELPDTWKCNMNPDKSAAACSVPEAALCLREEEDLIHGAYSAGSVVWARLAGWPWWPAMVDDCPDTEQYYWLDGFSDIPTHYNVVFFDAIDVTRAWISPENLKPYTPNKKTIKLSKDKRYKTRLEISMKQADDADKLSLEQRLAKYSFIGRYPGRINEPKNINKHDIKKFQIKMKRRYDIDFPIESEDEDDVPLQRQKTTVVIKKGRNMLLVGSPKSEGKKSRKINKVNTEKENPVTDLIKDSRSQQTNANSQITNVETDTENCINDSEIFKQPDSLVAQIGSNLTSTVADLTSGNDTSTTCVPGDENIILESLASRAISPNSDDFDF